MILPEGASCEDLANPSILHLYLKKHAAGWYRHLRIEEQYEISNGSLYLITGCDRPASQCCTWASIPARYPGRSLPSPNIDIRYRYENNSVSVTGQNNGNIMLYDYPRNSRVAVFIRGLRIALGAVSWPQTNNAFDSSREYYRSLSTPTVGRYAKVLQLRDRHFRVPENPEIEGILVSIVKPWILPRLNNICRANFTRPMLYSLSFFEWCVCVDLMLAHSLTKLIETNSALGCCRRCNLDVSCPWGNNGS